MIECYCQKEPDHIAIIDEGSSYKYSDLNHKANQLAHFLQKYPLKPNSVIAIAFDRSFKYMVGLFAILKLGCAYLPIDANQPKKRLQYILDNAQTPLLITHSKSKEQFSDFAGQVILLDHIWYEINSQPLDNLTHSVSPTNLAYVIYTSGSTGTPKGVLIEHRSVVNYTKWFSEYSKCRQQDRIDCSSSIIFDMAVTTTITALALGLQLVICPDEIKKNISRYLSYLKKNNINIIKITPSYFKILIQETNSHTIELSKLHSIILGGEILYTKDCLAWLKHYPTHYLYNEYGPTETTVAVTQYQVTNENVSQLGPIIPIGKPGLNIECKLFDESMQMVSLGEIGELFIGGICLAEGYLNQENLTKIKFNEFDSESHSKLYKSGDLCRYLPDGNLELLGRTDDQIKIRGFRLEPREIEVCLASHPNINEASIITSENASGEKQLIAYYTSKDDKWVLTKQELRQFLSTNLADYMIPAIFIKVKSFTLTENGKLDKKALPIPTIEEDYLEPKTKLEKILIEVWQNAFHTKNIGINSHFFELGGHSLIATRIISDVQKYTGKMLRLEDLYKAPTIHELAFIIEKSKGSQENVSSAAVALRKNSVTPLGDFQFIFWASNLFEPKIKKLNIIARRRMSGKLDITALRLALDWILKKHEILSCEISKYAPVIYNRNNLNINILEHDLSTYSEVESEKELSCSLDELTYQSLFRKYLPLIEVKLFYLEHDISELQISASHMSFDDASEEIFFTELSNAYLHYKNGYSFFSIQGYPQYKDYIAFERNNLNQNLERDIQFWEKYLQDTSLITFPHSEIINDMDNMSYSSYIDIPDAIMETAHDICSRFSISITDFLCAAVALSLKTATNEVNNNIYINIIRSVRENDIFDKMIGCFLRLDPIKLNLTTHLTLIELAKSIQRSRIETEPYQACSGMVKLACLNKKHQKKYIANSIMRIASTIYCKLFKKLQLNPIMLSMYGRLNSLRTKQQFLININLLNSFVTSDQNQSLFGFNLLKTETHPCDLLRIPNVLDISFLKNSTTNKMHLVITGNLTPSFRMGIGRKIINIINHIKVNEDIT